MDNSIYDTDCLKTKHHGYKKFDLAKLGLLVVILETIVQHDAAFLGEEASV